MKIKKIIKKGICREAKSSVEAAARGQGKCSGRSTRDSIGAQKLNATSRHDSQAPAFSVAANRVVESNQQICVYSVRFSCLDPVPISVNRIAQHFSPLQPRLSRCFCYHGLSLFLFSLNPALFDVNLVSRDILHKISLVEMPPCTLAAQAHKLKTARAIVLYC